MSTLKVSEDFKTQWKEFPHLRNLWNTAYLLQAQGVDFAPWRDDTYRFEISQGLFTKTPYMLTHHLDVGLSRGSIKGMVKYIGHDVLEVSGMDNILAKAFSSLYVPKYNGIISLTFSENVVLNAKLCPNREITDLYNKDMMRYLKKYYD